jgi:hypothetical protein
MYYPASVERRLNQSLINGLAATAIGSSAGYVGYKLLEPLMFKKQPVKQYPYSTLPEDTVSPYSPHYKPLR